MANAVDRIVFWISLAAISVAVVLFGVHTVPNPNITWDEAGQYWMSQGGSFGTLWDAPRAGLLEGLKLGRAGEILDPIGFTSLLAGWVAVFGPAPATLRALPFVFFLATLVVSYVLGRKVLGLPRSVSLILPAAILTTYVSTQWATEVRPYSFELLGVVVAVVAAIRYVQRPGWLRMTGLVAALALFCVGSRYSFAVAAAAAMLTVLLVMWRSRQLRSHVVEVVAGLVVMGLLAFFLVWNVGLLDGGKRVWAEYLPNVIRVESISDLESMRMLLQINFVYGWHKLTGAFVVLGLLGWVILRLRTRVAWLSGLGRALSTQVLAWLPAWLFVVLYEVLYALANQIGGPQWNAEHRHSIGLIGAAIVSGFGLLVLGRCVIVGVWSPVAARWPSRWRTATSVAGQVVAVAVLAGLTAMAVSHFSSFRRTDIETLGVSVPTRVASAVAGFDKVRWLSDIQLYPSLRYLVKDSGVPLGDLSIPSATAFGEYGHNPDELTLWLAEAGACQPGEVTAVLVANSAETNAPVFEAVTPALVDEGCSVEVVPLSDVESMLLVR